MPRKRLPNQRPKQFFRKWRDHLGLTQDQALGRLEGWSQSKISRIESGETVYNGLDLEDLSFAYGVSAWELQNVDPTKEREVVDLMPIFAKATADERKQIADYANFLLSKKSS